MTQPFFLLADIITGSSNYLLRTKLPYDGYRGVFGILVPFATMIYGFVGGFLAYKIIAIFLDNVIASLSINIVILSTSLLWYITGQVTMVHIHSFAALAALMYSTMPFLKGYLRNRHPEICLRRQLSCSGHYDTLSECDICAYTNRCHGSASIFVRKSDSNMKPLLKLIGKISLSVFSTVICFIPQIFTIK